MRVPAAIALIALTGCSNEPPDVIVHDRLVEIAGSNAIDCGRATLADQFAAHSTCAQNALSRKAPFVVQYKVQGIDAVSEEGLAFNTNGELFTVGTISWAAIYKGPSGKFESRKCDINKLDNLQGALTC